MTKAASDGSVLLETLALVVMLALHEGLFRRWLSPIASALTASMVVTLALAPFYAIRRPIPVKRMIVFVVLTVGFICLLGRLGW